MYAYQKIIIFWCHVLHTIGEIGDGSVSIAVLGRSLALEEYLLNTILLLININFSWFRYVDDVFCKLT